jgi:hypothetical protein
VERLACGAAGGGEALRAVGRRVAEVNDAPVLALREAVGGT